MVPIMTSRVRTEYFEFTYAYLAHSSDCYGAYPALEANKWIIVPVHY